MSIDPAIAIGIQVTLTRLMHSLDRGDLSSFADCWADDVDFAVTFGDGRTIPAQGKAAIMSMSGLETTKNPGALRHVLGPVEILAIEGNRASTFSYCTYYAIETGSIAGIGEYHDELLKESDGVWRVAKRRHKFLSDIAVKVAS